MFIKNATELKNARKILLLIEQHMTRWETVKYELEELNLDDAAKDIQVRLIDALEKREDEIVAAIFRYTRTNALATGEGNGEEVAGILALQDFGQGYREFAADKKLRKSERSVSRLMRLLPSDLANNGEDPSDDLRAHDLGNGCWAVRQDDGTWLLVDEIGRVEAVTFNHKPTVEDRDAVLRSEA